MKYTQEQIDKYRAQWLAQLRSPEAKKTTGKLEDPDAPEKRCCLGHACHALGAKRTVERREAYEHRDTVFYGEKYGEASWLPLEVRQKLNISLKGSFRVPVPVDGITVNALSIVNDYTKLLPSEIADIIEAQFKADNFLPYGGV